MKNIFMLLIFSGFISILNAQSGWFLQESPVSSSFYAVSFADANRGIAVGRGGTIIHTTNGGETWIIDSSGITSNLIGVSYPDTSTGFAVGNNGTILRTTNGGETWIKLNSGTNSILNAVSFPDVNNGTVVGDKGIILRTTDKGETWANQLSETSDNFNSVSFADSSSGIILSYPNYYHTTDGGKTWEKYTYDFFNLTGSVRAVSLSDKDNGVAVGGRGLILRTKNGGIDWTVDSSRTNNELYAVSCVDSNIAMAVGLGGLIFRTTNGGDDWISQDCGSIQPLLGVCFTDANTGTAVGINSTLLRTTTGGEITDVEDNQSNLLEDRFVLEQNYPNPFNPETVISFTIGTSQIPVGTRRGVFVQIKVYDVLGREVETLVNEVKPAGTYKVSFDAGNLSSGIYFYKIAAGNFVQTRKMILNK